MTTQAIEAVKKLIKEQKRLTQSRQDARGRQTKKFSFALLCVFAPWREIVYLFTAHHELARATGMKMGDTALSSRVKDCVFR